MRISLLRHHHLMVQSRVILHLIVHVLVHWVYLFFASTKHQAEDDESAKKYYKHPEESLGHHSGIQL